MFFLSLATLCGCSAASQPVTAVREDRFITTSTGRIDSAQEARDLVAETDGVIESVSVSIGDRVQAGQTLLKVACGPQAATVAVRDASKVEADASADKVINGARIEDVRAAAAQAQAAQVLTEDARDRLHRAQALVSRGFVSGRTVTGLENAVRQADAQHTAAQAALDILRSGSREEDRRQARGAVASAAAQVSVARALRDRCVLKSPITGTVLQILRRAGEFSGASQGTPLIIVGDLSRMIVRAEVTDRSAAQIRTGQSATVWVDGQTTRWSGRVTRLASVMGRRTARSLDPTDRFDRDVREAIIEFPHNEPPKLVGLRVNVGIAQ
jgi:multidrug resistance efflux pump